jgi:hypothetical protein
VLERGSDSLKIPEDLRQLLSQAPDHCTIGQALAALGEEAEAQAALDRAVATMQQAGFTYHPPAMHLARAHHPRDPAAAWQDHAAALAIAQRGNMRTYLAECALLAGHLYLDAGQVGPAGEQHARAAALLHEDGYGRRLAELHILDARLRHHQHDPQAARTALAAAQACLRELGQWGLWRALVAVAHELGQDIPEDCPAPHDPAPPSLWRRIARRLGRGR